jgi:hypothetical protein
LFVARESTTNVPPVRFLVQGREAIEGVEGQLTTAEKPAAELPQGLIPPIHAPCRQATFAQILEPSVRLGPVQVG